MQEHLRIILGEQFPLFDRKYTKYEIYEIKRAVCEWQLMQLLFILAKQTDGAGIQQFDWMTASWLARAAALRALSLAFAASTEKTFSNTHTVNKILSQ